VPVFPVAADDLLRAFHVRLAALGLKASPEALDDPGRSPAPAAHESYTVEHPRTNSMPRQGRHVEREGAVRVLDQIRVTMCFRIPLPSEEVRQTAAQWEERVRQHLTRDDFEPAGPDPVVTYLASERDYHPRSRGWWLVRILVSVQRDAPLGDVP